LCSLLVISQLFRKSFTKVALYPCLSIHPAHTHNTTQRSTTQHNAAQHNTTQHNTTQHNTTQHNTTHPPLKPSISGTLVLLVVWAPPSPALASPSTTPPPNPSQPETFETVERTVATTLTGAVLSAPPPPPPPPPRPMAESTLWSSFASSWVSRRGALANGIVLGLIVAGPLGRLDERQEKGGGLETMREERQSKGSRQGRSCRFDWGTE